MHKYVLMGLLLAAPLAAKAQSAPTPGSAIRPVYVAPRASAPTANTASADGRAQVQIQELQKQVDALSAALSQQDKQLTAARAELKSLHYAFDHHNHQYEDNVVVSGVSQTNQKLSTIPFQFCHPDNPAQANSAYKHYACSAPD